jgi:hypothetical protein
MTVQTRLKGTWSKARLSLLACKQYVARTLLSQESQGLEPRARTEKAGACRARVKKARS